MLPEGVFTNLYFTFLALFCFLYFTYRFLTPYYIIAHSKVYVKRVILSFIGFSETGGVGRELKIGENKGRKIKMRAE